jgi:uncharacterized protein (DUF885 family)
MRIKSIYIICWLLICIISAQTIQAQPNQTKNTASTGQSEKLNKLFEEYFEERLRLYPFQATAIADPRYNDQLPNSLSDEYRARERDFYTKYSKALGQINRQSLSSQNRLSYDVFKVEMERSLEGLKFADFKPINQFTGLSIAFVQLGSGKGNQPFKTVKDYENFLSRVNGFVIWMDQAIANMRQGMAKGVVQPKVLMERTLPQLQAVIVKDAKDSIFYQPITNIPASFSEADKARLTAAYVKAINGQIIPAYQKLHDFIKSEYLPKSRATAGLSAIPTGKEQYAYLVKASTTTDLSPDEIHQIGLNEVRRIRGEMEKVKEQVGFKGSLSAFFDYIRTDPKFYPFKTEEEVLEAYRSIEAKLQPHLPKYFGIVPKSKFEVRATEKFRAASAAHQYNRPAPDGSRPGIFYVPIPDVRKYNNTTMESLFLHEAIPGHHFQISLQQEQQSLPKFRNFGGYSAFSEGWALYTESLGKELGLYQDPYQYFGMLSGEIHRAIRLVVDTAIHAQGWSREQAIKYSLENESMSEDRITAEIERYMAMPGQALSYKIGQLKILELRRKAERTLGAKFDIRAFHDEILKDGALPLNILESKINEWIVKQQQSR